MSIILKTPLNLLATSNTFKDWMDSFNYLAGLLAFDSNGRIGTAAVPAIADATTSVKGKIAIIDSNGVVLAGDDTKAVTANKLKVYINNRIIDSNGAAAGTDDFKLMTAAKTKAAITTLSPQLPDATTSVKGKVQLASNGETQALSIGTKVVTPANLATLLASTTQKGIAKIADSNGVVLGGDDTTIVTPNKLKVYINNRIADSNGAADGTDDVKLMTPAKTKVAIQAISPNVPDASTSVKGKVQLASNSETQALSNSAKAITPSGLATLLASTTQKGIAQIVDSNGVMSGTDDTKIVTANKLKLFWALKSLGLLPGKLIVTFDPFGNIPPATNFATLGFRNGHPFLAFDTTTQEAATWVGVLPAGYGGSGLNVAVHWACSTATSGTVGWTVEIEKIGTSQDVDADGFATAQTITAATTNATSGIINVTNVNISDGANMDSLSGGDLFRIRIKRDVANDNAAGDAELYAVVIREQ